MALQGLSFWSLTGSPKIWTSTVDLYAVELLRGEEEEDAALARRLMEAGAPAWTRDLENAPAASPEDMEQIAAMANAAGDQSQPPSPGGSSGGSIEMAPL